MKIYLVRHGESVANKEKIIQGHLDCNLTELGKIQTKKISQKLKEEKFDLIFSSDLIRAQDTAREINNYHNKDIILDKRLREIDRGDWSGHKNEEFPEYKYQFTNYNLRAPNGESYLDHINRVKDFLNYNREFFLDKSVLIVSHGGTIRALLKNLLNISIEEAIKYKTSNTCLYILEYRDEKHKIVLENCTKHLD